MPGRSPLRAISLNVILDKPKYLIYALGRPLTKSRLRTLFGCEFKGNCDNN